MMTDGNRFEHQARPEASQRLDLHRRVHRLPGMLIDAAAQGGVHVGITGTDAAYFGAWSAEVRADRLGPPEPYVLLRPFLDMEGSRPHSALAAKIDEALASLMGDGIPVGLLVWPADLMRLRAPVTCGDDGLIRCAASTAARTPIRLKLEIYRIRE